MINFLRLKIFPKYKKEIVLSLAILIVYFLSRLFFITKPLIYADENMYIRWAQIVLTNPYNRLVSLDDGRQPVFIWVISFFMIFIKDPLLAGRIVSVFTGLVTMLGMGILSYILFKKKSITFLSVLLYLVYPFAVVYDRMALLDSMVSMFLIWGIIASIILVKRIKLDIAYTLGFILGAGILTKTNATLGIYLLPLSLLFFDFKQKAKLLRLSKWLLYVIIASVIVQLLSLIIILHPKYQIVLAANSLFIYPIKKFIQLPLPFILNNFQINFLKLGGFALDYLKLPYILLTIFSLATIRKFTKEKLFLFLYFLIPISLYSLFGKTNFLFPRHILFATLPLLILCAWSLDYFLQKKSLIVKSLIILIAIAYPSYVSLTFIVNPTRSAITKWDRETYTDKNIGWGFNESVRYFQGIASKEKIFIAGNGIMGQIPQGLEIYLSDNKNIKIKGYYFSENTVPEEIYSYQKQMRTFFVTSKERGTDFEKKYNLKLISATKIGSTNRDYRIYEVMEGNLRSD